MFCIVAWVCQYLAPWWQALSSYLVVFLVMLVLTPAPHQFIITRTFLGQWLWFISSRVMIKDSRYFLYFLSFFRGPAGCSGACFVILSVQQVWLRFFYSFFSQLRNTLNLILTESVTPNLSLRIQPGTCDRKYNYRVASLKQWDPIWKLTLFIFWGLFLSSNHDQDNIFMCQ